jgi:hypothetical protein
MTNNSKSVSRKKFLSWGIVFTSLLAVPSIFHFNKKKKGSGTVKMLTQDGQLVEINVDHIPSAKKKIKAADIHTWVKKPNTL